jgi:predicted kinase
VPTALTTVRLHELRAAIAATRPGLVLPIAASASGKSRLAAGFDDDQVSSLDTYRRLVSGNSGDQNATADAVTVQQAILTARLARPHLITYIDSTNCEDHIRRGLLKLAADHGRTAIGLFFGTDLATCQARNARRSPRSRVPDDVLTWQYEQARHARDLAPHEGFAALYLLSEPH